ncbi:MAG: TrkA C-terminal domain-containing protein [Lentisphaerae bacterium]|nr:TrkA C-terminal domain-containing protein [Lentisphaerota bacterium]
MIAVLSLLITLSLSLLVTRIGAMALMLTGMSSETARFQARSAFTGVGFTTQESESIVTHPVRRRIVMLMMLLGNVGIAAVVATLMLSMLRTSQSDQGWTYMLMLLAGLLLLGYLAKNRVVARQLNRLIARGLQRWGNLTVRDHIAILQLERGYAVSELLVEDQDWLSGKTLMELKLPNEGVLVLGIRREDGAYLGTPTAEMEVHTDDTLVIYGPISRIEELDQRRKGRSGEVAHQEAVQEQAEVIGEQRDLDDEPEQEEERL